MASENQRGVKSGSGMVWLARHPRRDDIVRYVTAGGREPRWLADDPARERVRRDRVVWALRAARRLSLRCIAAHPTVGISVEQVRSILNAYGRPGELRAEYRPRLDLRERARRVVTPAVVRAWRDGATTTAEVSGLLGGGVSSKNALYWLRTLGRKYDALGLMPPA